MNQGTSMLVSDAQTVPALAVADQGRQKHGCKTDLKKWCKRKSLCVARS